MELENDLPFRRALTGLSAEQARRNSESTETLVSPYQTVRALMIDWKDAREKDFREQRDRLSAEFKKYRFLVEPFSIESEKPYQKLAARLLEFLSHDAPGTLFIIYYGGHGMNNKDKAHIWLW